MISHRFQWVFCHLETLRQALPPSVRSILEGLPECLDKTYDQILKGTCKTNQRIAHRLLQCLVVAVHPLRIEELAEVLVVDFDMKGSPPDTEPRFAVGGSRKGSDACMLQFGQHSR